MLSSPDLIAKLALDPSTRAFLSQPDFMAMLSEVQRKPDSFAQHMSDPRMMKVLSVALGINVMSGADAAREEGNELFKQQKVRVARFPNPPDCLPTRD